MTFVTSGLAIAGALAIGIPILIHLLARQRRKPIEWAAMRFLIEAFRKHKRRLQLEQLLLLVVRCLIVGLLGAALARPILEATGIIPSGGSRAVYLVMDDGLVSGVTDEDGRTALQHHVRQAADLVNTLGPGDAVGVITAARPAKSLLSPPSTDHDSVINLLQSLVPKESPTDLSGAIGLAQTATTESRQNQDQAAVYVFSEFRGGSAALESPLPTLPAGATDAIRFFASSPASQPVSNVQVIAIEPVRSVIQPGASDGSGQITVRLARSGDAATTADVSTVRLAGDGLAALEPRVVRWQPGQSRADVKFQVTLPATPESASASTNNDRPLALTASIDADPLTADNQRHTVLDVRRQIRVLLIDRRSFGIERSLDQLTAGQWIRRALEPVAAADRERGPIQVVEVEPAALDLPDLRTTDVAILPRPDLLTDAGWTALRQFVDRNGLLILMPPGETNIHQWTERFAAHMNLSWRPALEVQIHDEGMGMAESQPPSEWLRLISGELAELLRPVLAYRSLGPAQDGIAPNNAGSMQPLLVFADGSPMILAASPETNQTHGSAVSNEIDAKTPVSQTRGMICYLAVAPELSWTNLPSKPLMVPLVQELVRQGLSVIRGAQQIQVAERPSIGRGPAANSVVSPDGRRMALDSSGRTEQPLDHAGVYAVHDQSDQPIGMFAVNIDSSAGTTEVNTPATVLSWLNTQGTWQTFDANTVSATLASDQSTSPIAGVLLLIVLGLVVLETILARRFSHAYQVAIGGQPSSTSYASKAMPSIASSEQPS